MKANWGSALVEDPPMPACGRNIGIDDVVVE
jgi:hypothetical protein